MPEINEVTIKEYSNNKNNPIELSDSEYDYLINPRFHKNLNTFEVFRETKGDNYYINNSSYAGIIQLSNTKRITFSTKVRANLFFLLSCLKREPQFLFDPDIAINIKEGENFFDVIGRLFANEMNDLLEAGLLKKYISRHENLNFLKGKLDIKTQIQHQIRGEPKFACFYGDLTFDNQENRIILRALDELVPLIRFNDDLRDELVAMEYLLRDVVSLIPISPQECDTVAFDRLNNRYQGIIRFSKIILEEKYIRSTEKGEAKGFNFIVNMNNVFENFVTGLIEKVVRDNPKFVQYEIRSQKPFRSLDIEGKLSIIPDILIKRKGEDGIFPVILDTKYKAQDQNSDYYQIISYALAIPTARKCCLIYAQEFIQGKDLIVSRNLLKLDRDINILVRGVDLLLDEDMEFKDYIPGMKSQIEGILSDLLY